MKKTRQKPAQPPVPSAPAPAACRGIPRRHLLAVAALWVVVLAAYANSFGSGLVVDNAYLIAGDPRIQAVTPRHLDLIFGEEYWYGNSTSELYRPLTTLSYLFNYAILGNGPRPAGYHAINLALHAVNLALVYWLALWIFEDLAAALAMAGLWALHPVLTESVTNIVGRADLLAALGVLGGLLCHVHAGRAVGRRRVAWLAGLALAAAVGIFSKESAIALLGVMALADLALGERSALSWGARVTHYAAAAVPCLAFLYVRAGVLERSLYATVPFTDNPLVGAGFWEARVTAVSIVGRYLALLAWPGRLSSDYSYNQIPVGGALAAVVALLVIVLFAAALVYGWRRERRLFFFAGLFLIALAPTSNVFLLIGTIMAERFLYLPALAFAGCVVLAAGALAARVGQRRLLIPAVAAPLCLVFTLRTFARNFDWASNQTIMASAAVSAPGSFKPHMALAAMLGESPRAAAEADRTRAILDGLPDEQNSIRAYVNVGFCYRNQGDAAAQRDPAEAARWYRQSLDALLRARAIEQLYDRANQRENLARGKGSTSFAWHEVYRELGRTYRRLGQFPEAIEAFRHGRLLGLRPEFFAEIAETYRVAGDARQAAVTLMEGIAIDSSQTGLARELLRLYRETDPQGCEIRSAPSEGGLNMNCPTVKSQLCSALRQVAKLYQDIGQKDASARTTDLVGKMSCPEE